MNDLAVMAESADAPALGAGKRKLVKVRILLTAPFLKEESR
jgi:hypothetical protein